MARLSFKEQTTNAKPEEAGPHPLRLASRVFIQRIVLGILLASITHYINSSPFQPSRAAQTSREAEKKQNHILSD